MANRLWDPDEVDYAMKIIKAVHEAMIKALRDVVREVIVDQKTLQSKRK